MARLDHLPPAERAQAPSDRWLRRTRLVTRLLCGFGDPVRESGLLALALRSKGYPAQLVVACEPLPAGQARRVTAWVRLDGHFAGGTGPTPWFYPELVHFPQAPAAEVR